MREKQRSSFYRCFQFIFAFCILLYFHDAVTFDKIIQDFAIQSNYSVKEREGKGENLRDRKDGDKEDIEWKERRGQGERDRSDRVAYNVVAGSRKEQQIQWLYRPSPV